MKQLFLSKLYKIKKKLWRILDYTTAGNLSSFDCVPVRIPIRLCSTLCVIQKPPHRSYFLKERFLERKSHVITCLCHIKLVDKTEYS